MLLFGALLLCAAVSHVLGNVPQSEINALHDLYTATNGLYWAWTATGKKWNFTGSPNPCSPVWQGIQCLASTSSDPYQHVYRLSLNSFLLRGTLPSSLSSLTHLSTLSLRSNALNGTIPASFGSLATVTTLHLGINALTGTLPASLGNMKALNFMYLYTNQLRGTIPPQFGNLTNLGFLELDTNRLTGTIPSTLGKLSRLQILDLYENQLYGTIPAVIGNLLHLATLDLHSNNLQGSIPWSLGNLLQLTLLDVSSNELDGTIPVSLGNLTRLQTLSIYYNQVSGSIPAQLGKLTSLTFLGLLSNQLVGSIPSSLGALSRLQWLYLDDNLLHGRIPTELGQLTSLYYLGVSNNGLTGPIPTSLGSCVHLAELYLHYNLLTGTIPPQLGNLTALTQIVLIENKLTGPIPDSMSQLQRLQLLSLANNQLQGTVPQWLQTFSALEALDLSTCQLSGTLPAFLFNLSSLTTLTMDGNRLTGPLPTFSPIASAVSVKTGSAPLLSKISRLDLRSNAFTGPLPDWLITSMLVADNFDLGFNQLTGPLPDAFQSLTGLSFFEVCGNQLTGTLPSSVCALPVLTYFSVHDNQFTGTLPLCLGNMTTLGNLLFSHNFLTSTVPAALTQLPSLTRLYLDSNLFTGSLPEIMANSSLTDLSAGYNFIRGTIPASIGNALQLEFLQLSGNRFSGTLPETLGALSYLQLLWISNATLSGCIPTSFNQMKALVQVFLDTNALQCSLEGVFNASLQVALSDIRVDGNQITGALPDELFRLPALRSFVAIGNCMSGTLPAAICESSTLSSLILDGLHSATVCHTEIFSLTNSYVAGTGVHGTIPACVMNMSSLVSLHLSGNSLTGALPDAVGHHMLDLTLSHNLLSGTLPTAYQQRGWENLDVSYNRLTGELASDFGDYRISITAVDGNATKTTVFPFIGAVQNNRISGKVPAASARASNITALGSNLFSCMADKSDLPQADGDRDNYQCGSDAFDTPYYIFIAFAGAMAVLVLYAVVSKTRYADVVLHLFRKWSAEADMGPRPWRQVQNMSEIMCTVAVGCTVMIVVLLVPWYAAASGSYGTYTHQYAWVLSAAFLSGTAPAVAELFLFAVIMAVAVIGTYVILVRKDNVEKIGGEHESTTDVAPTALAAPQAINATVYAVYLVVNCIAVVGINVAFLVIVLTQNNAVVSAAQVALSVFKLVWNSACTPRLVRFATAFLPGARFTSTFVTVQLFIALLNNIAIPCLLVAVLSPSCFYSVFDAPPAVESTYFVLSCQSDPDTGVDCSSSIPYQLTSTYNPPFRYSYQCSSSFVTYYAPAFVYLAITAGMVVPAVQLSALHFLKSTRPGTLADKMLSKIVPPILRSSAPAQGSGSVNNPVHSDGGGAAQGGERSEEQTPAPQEVLCDANKLLAALVTYLGILLTFGVVFPPLALAMCFTMLSVAWQEKLAVGRFLCAIKEMKASMGPETIARDCKGAASLTKLTKSIFLVVGLGCCFVALFVFDTLGDETGVDGAYWVLIVLPLMPVCMYLVLEWWCRYYAGRMVRPLGLSIDSRVVRKQERGAHEGDEGVELGPLGGRSAAVIVKVSADETL